MEHLPEGIFGGSIGPIQGHPQGIGSAERGDHQVIRIAQGMDLFKEFKGKLAVGLEDLRSLLVEFYLFGLLIAGINMITALLVLILERTQMIGILKALGNHNWSIRKIFLYNAAFLIGKGLLWGNLIGVGLLLIQKYFGIITLNPETYYVNQAPVYLSIPALLWINFGTLLLCVLMLIVPSFIVSKISPVKAIKFD